MIDEPPSFPNDCCPNQASCTCFDWDNPPDVRLVLCEACGSEGRVIRERRFPGCEPEEIDEGPCPACEGTCSEIIEVQPIEMEDLP